MAFSCCDHEGERTQHSNAIVLFFFFPLCFSCVCRCSRCSFMFRASCFHCEAVLLLLMRGETHRNRSLDVSISNACGLLQTWWSQLGGFVDQKKKKKGPASHYERDIVPHRPYSSFVDKWIFMLIKWDTDMSEKCGECGIILTIRSYTWITVVLSVCGLSLSFSGAAFNPNLHNIRHNSCKYHQPVENIMC